MSIQKRMYLLTLFLVLFTAGSMFFMRVYQSWEDSLQHEYEESEAIAKMLGQQLTGTYSDLLSAGLTEEEQVLKLNQLLQPIADQITHAFPGYGAGYYVKDLHSIVAYGPNFQISGLKDIRPESKAREVYQTKKPLKYYDYSQTRGNAVVATIYPIIRNGQVIGHVWGNITVGTLQEMLWRRIQEEIWIWGLLLAMALAATYMITSQYTKSISIFRDRIQKMDMNKEEEPQFLPEMMEIYQLVMQYISRRKEAEEELRLAYTIVENTLESVMVTDKAGTIRSVNPAFSRMTGYDAEEVIGMSPSMLKSGQHPQSFYRDLWKSLKEHGAWKGEIWNRRKDGEIYPEWKTIVVVKDGFQQPTHYVSVASDITELKAKEKEIQYLAFHDALTGLPNRYYLREHSAFAMSQAEKSNQWAAVLLLDLDRFKHVNDSLGHAVGDDLLLEVSRRLELCMRSGDTVARMGGDEFLILLCALSCSEEAAAVAETILSEFERPFELQEHSIFIGGSIGISYYPDHGEHIDILVKNADAAMYRAKAEGSGYRIYAPSMNDMASKRLELEYELRKALERDELEVYYQPQFDLDDLRLVGAEALVRWNHPEKGIVSPAEFIPVAEETGLIIPMGEMILRTACLQAKKWQLEGHPRIRLSVNLSSRQFKHKNILQVVRKALEESELLPDDLELEITESMAMNFEYANEILQDLKSLGVRIALDDFGTGYSSLSYLHRFPIDTIKIDQSFVRLMNDHPDNQSIVAAIIGIARHMGMHVIAEGVETEQHLFFLRQHQCDMGQGYFFARPAPAHEIEQYLNMAKMKA